MRLDRERLPASQHGLLAAIEDEVGVVFDQTNVNMQALARRIGKNTYVVKEGLYKLQAKGFLSSARQENGVWRWSVTEGV